MVRSQRSEVRGQPRESLGLIGTLRRRLPFSPQSGMHEAASQQDLDLNLLPGFRRSFDKTLHSFGAGRLFRLYNQTDFWQLFL